MLPQREGAHYLEPWPRSLKSETNCLSCSNSSPITRKRWETDGCPPQIHKPAKLEGTSQSSVHAQMFTFAGAKPRAENLNSGVHAGDPEPLQGSIATDPDNKVLELILQKISFLPPKPKFAPSAVTGKIYLIMMLSSGCQGKSSIHTHPERFSFESCFGSNRRARGAPFFKPHTYNMSLSQQDLSHTPGITVSTPNEQRYMTLSGHKSPS